MRDQPTWYSRVRGKPYLLCQSAILLSHVAGLHFFNLNFKFAYYAVDLGVRSSSSSQQLVAPLGRIMDPAVAIVLAVLGGLVGVGLLVGVVICLRRRRNRERARAAVPVVRDNSDFYI